MRWDYADTPRLAKRRAKAKQVRKAQINTMVDNCITYLHQVNKEGRDAALEALYATLRMY